MSGLCCLHVGNHWVLVGSRDSRIYLLRGADGRLESSWSLDKSPVECVALNRDESLAAIGTRSGGVHVIRIPGGKTLDSLERHDERLTAVTFSPDGRYLIAGSRDGTARLYKSTGDGFELLLTLGVQHQPIRSLQFSPDGARLGVLLENEHAVRIWDLDQLQKDSTRSGWTGTENSDRSACPTPVFPKINRHVVRNS